MSGTSLDGIDVALCSFENNACQLLETHFAPYSAQIKTELLALHKPGSNELETSALMGNNLAVMYADAVKTLLSSKKIDASTITAIGCHGQTIRHRPGFNDGIGFTPVSYTHLDVYKRQVQADQVKGMQAKVPVVRC